MPFQKRGGPSKVLKLVIKTPCNSRYLEPHVYTNSCPKVGLLPIGDQSSEKGVESQLLSFVTQQVYLPFLPSPSPSSIQGTQGGREGDETVSQVSSGAKVTGQLCLLTIWIIYLVLESSDAWG